MQLTRQDRKHWHEVLFDDGVLAAVCNDGALVMFDLKDVEKLLDANYPRGDKVWYFNQSLDREIAEIRFGRVYANPQVMWRHFKIAIEE